MGILITIGVIAFFVLCGYAGLKLVHLRQWAYQRQRAHLIEQDMRQQLVDGGTQKRVAAKLLREAGQKP